MNDYQTKLQHFAALLQVQCKLSGVGCQANLDKARTKIVPGKKYDKVNVGGSGRFMVDKTTGEIFGIKGYGQIHKGHQYGTLETIAAYWWGDYTAAYLNAPKGWEALIPNAGIVTPEEAAAACVENDSRCGQGYTIREIQTPYAPTERTADSGCPAAKLNAQEAL